MLYLHKILVKSFLTFAGLKAYYNTYELATVAQITQTGSLHNVASSTTVLNLNPSGDCDSVGFDEVALWSRPLTQDEIIALRLGPFANDTGKTLTFLCNVTLKADF